LKSVSITHDHSLNEFREK
jgi:hypothetical protein